VHHESRLHLCSSGEFCTLSLVRKAIVFAVHSFLCKLLAVHVRATAADVADCCRFGSLLACETFHADVHAGNLLVLEDGRVGFIDFGKVV